MSPINPNGNLGASETFANLVDQMPSQTSSYSPSSTLISQTYKQIVDGANSTNKPDPAQEEKYKQQLTLWPQIKRMAVIGALLTHSLLTLPIIMPLVSQLFL